MDVVLACQFCIQIFLQYQNPSLHCTLHCSCKASVQLIRCNRRCNQQSRTLLQTHPDSAVVCLCYRLRVAVKLVLSVILQSDMTIGLLFYQVCQIFAGFVVPLCRLKYVGKLDGDVVIICRCLVTCCRSCVCCLCVSLCAAAAAGRQLIAIVAASTTDNTFSYCFFSFS